jgi:hypothetical protein
MSDQLKLELDSYDARFILEALQEMSDKWHHINRTTTDEDETGRLRQRCHVS